MHLVIPRQSKNDQNETQSILGESQPQVGERLQLLVHRRLLHLRGNPLGCCGRVPRVGLKQNKHHPILSCDT